MKACKKHFSPKILRKKVSGWNFQQKWNHVAELGIIFFLTESKEQHHNLKGTEIITYTLV